MLGLQFENLQELYFRLQPLASGVSVLDHANLLPAISNIALKNIKQAIFSWGFIGHRCLADRGTHRTCSSDMSLAKFVSFDRFDSMIPSL